MDKSSAKLHIESTLKHSFDERRFLAFAKNLLNEVDESKTFEYHGQLIPEGFRDHIHQSKRLAQYTDREKNVIDVLSVSLKKDTSLDRARTMQRNFVAHHLKIRKHEAALVAYHVDGSSDWRFSLVRMEYRSEKTETGKIKMHEDLTPARRYSFLVGENEPNHTAQSQLLPIISDDEKNPTLEDLERAFSIESVTKEFFTRYKELFLELTDELDRLVKKDKKIRDDFARKSVDTTTFAKKLLGQIVFLYFLQKKGWMGVERSGEWGSGPKNFLRKLYDQELVPYKNFFNDLLEPLFYEALAIDRGEDAYYSKLKCKIPFLNGGLFEPIAGYDWTKTDISLDNKTFEKIFKTFDEFNFTVREDEPLEREVAVDPEMLGKVFENLLEVKDRKSKGAFYTPREIVHYMCQESLINYLATETDEKVAKDDIATLVRYGELAMENDAAKAEGRKKGDYVIPEGVRKNAALIDKKLEAIRVCDPAIGSGAFPVGMMTEIVRARQALTPFIKVGAAVPLIKGDGSRSDQGVKTDAGMKTTRTAYDFKRHAIQSSLYGVDIDASAVDIAKLRLWLSLVVDEDDFLEIKPLPNLDYKIVCGNSLLGVEENLFNNQEIDDLEKLKPLYFDEINPRKKKELKEKIDALLKRIAHDADGKPLFDFKIHFSEVFHEKGGFDVVIGNPPYGGEYSEEEKKYFLNSYISAKTVPGFKGSLDTFTLFIERSVNCLANDSNLHFIVTIAFTSSDSMAKLHKMLEDNCDEIRVSSYAVRPQPVFENAVVNTSIVFLRKTGTKCEQLLSTKMYRRSKNFNLERLIRNLKYVDVKEFKLVGRYPKIGSAIEQDILRKLFNGQHKPIRDLIKNVGKPIYYRTTGGRYFKVVTNYSTGSTQEKPIHFDKEIADTIGCILSSSFFFWYYQIYSDNLHIKSYEVESFTIPISKINNGKRDTINGLWEEYLKDIERNASVRQTKKYANIDSFKEYKIGKSKKIIDKIDDVIGPLYGLTKEEIEFIKNYEIEFRLGDEE